MTHGTHQPSNDLIAIQKAVSRFRTNDEFHRTVFDPGWARFDEDFNSVARLLNGEESLKFRVLRILRRFFDRRQIFMLSLFASKSAYQDWHLEIRRRKPGEKPDRGQRDRTRGREQRVNRVGMKVYGLMSQGISKERAVAVARQELGLHVSEATVEKDLVLFRKKAQENGFVDPYAAFVAWVGGYPPDEPKITVADVTKRGRPKKR